MEVILYILVMLFLLPTLIKVISAVGMGILHIFDEAISQFIKVEPCSCGEKRIYRINNEGKVSPHI